MGVTTRSGASTPDRRKTSSAAAQAASQGAKRTVKVDMDLLQKPSIAWPTLIVFFGAFAAWYWAFNAYRRGVSVWVTVPVSFFSIFALFTPLHDAAHGAVSPKHRWINSVIGRIIGVVFCAPYVAFRYVHLEHHKHTNDPEKDPDFWSGSGPTIFKPFRWACQEFHYYVAFLKVIHTFPLATSAEAVLSIVATVIGLRYGFTHGYGELMLWTWLLPERLAVTFLAYTFDYIPHRPHKIDRATNPYKTTSKIDGVFDVEGSDLTLLLFYQTYHNIHHLYPFIPFYRYKAVWDRHRDDLLKAGTPVVPAYDSNNGWW